MTKAGAADLQWTSVPRWTRPVLPPAASYLACWFSHAARQQMAALLATADPAVPVTSAGLGPGWDAGAEAELTRLLGACCTGVRIILAGPEAVVMRAAALARQAGAVSEELVLLADEAAAASDTDGRRAGESHVATGDRQVYCVTCERPFGAVAALGELVTCPGCGARLTVDIRFSRAHAAYLGWPSRPGPRQ